MPLERESSRGPHDKPRVFAPPSHSPPVRPCPKLEELGTSKRVRSSTLGTTPVATQDKRGRTMDPEFPARSSVSLNSDDVTPHRDKWGTGMPPGKGMIPTDLGDESDSEDDLLLDRSGVPLPPKEPEAASSAASSGINPVASEYMTDVSRSSDDLKQLSKTDAEHIKIVAETTIKLEQAEKDMETLRQERAEDLAEQKRREEVHFKMMQDKDIQLEASQKQINELKLPAEPLN